MRRLTEFLLLAIVFICTPVVFSEDEVETPARLLIEKRVLNKYLVENRDLIVAYNIFNVGGSAATNVQVSDGSFDPQSFTVISGLLNFVIPRIAPNTNVTHTVVLRPKPGIWGRYNFTSAEVTYRAQESASDVQSGYTSEPGEGFIVTLKEFDRRFSPHVLDWLAFAIMTLPPLVIPFLLWHRSRSKYDSLVVPKKGK